MSAKGIIVLEEAPASDGLASKTLPLPALEDVANRPIVHHVLDALLDAGVEELVVAGAAGPLTTTESSLRNYRRGRIRLEFAECAADADLVGKLRVARRFIEDQPCVVHLADGLLGEELIPHLLGAAARSMDLTVLAGRAGRDRTIRPLRVQGGKPEREGGAGIGLFGPQVFSHICETYGGSSLSDLHVLADQLRRSGGNVEILPVEGWRRYAGDPRGLLDLNRIALDGIRGSVIPINARGNQIEGRVRIHSTATVTGSVIFGPVVIGPGARIADAYIGPYTSIGRDVTVEGAEIERSIISPGASVLHVGGRLVSSLVGRDARVLRDFSVPRALRLWVSAGDEVALC